MEDFIQILFFLIIIISFLSSLFKKKEPPAPQQGRTPSNKPEREHDISGFAKPETSSEDYDILREIESIFKTGEEISKPKTLDKPSMNRTPIEESRRSPSETTSYEQDRSISETTSYERERSISEVTSYEKQREHSESSITSSEHTMGNWWEKDIKKIKESSKVDKATADKAEQFKKSLLKKRREEDVFIKNLRERFRNPSALKEYIIISEIIGKPKSLQE